MKKVLFLVPHLSTGGMPQYTYDLMRKIQNDVEVYCIEYSMISWDFVVQRNRIIDLLQDRFFCLGENKEELFDLIEKINPDIIHLQEMPEYFLPSEISDKLYSNSRKYLIVETSHDSSFYHTSKRYYPDHFALISEYQIKEFSKLGIPINLVESDIEYKERQDRTEGLLRLGLDPNLKHVLNVGLFTPRKNQAEAIDYARSLENYPIQFHFVGNQADNFSDYWKPLLENLPSNVKIWGERSDIDDFYSCMDLMLFTSRGTGNDKETSPLVIRESIGYNLPTLIYNLPVYLGMYDKYKTITYLTDDNTSNCELILNKLNINYDSEMNLQESFNRHPYNVRFEDETNKLFFTPNYDLSFTTLISIKDIDSKVCIYSIKIPPIHKGNVYWAMPLPKHVISFKDDITFGGFLIEFYSDENDIPYQTEKIRIKDISIDKPIMELSKTEPIFNNYVEFFVNKIYDEIDIKDCNVVIDAGANIGLWTKFILTRGANKVYCLEPNKRALSELKKNMKGHENVTIIPTAIGTKNGQIKFYEDENSLISSIYPNDSGIVDEVDCITIDKLFQQISVDKVDLFKLDIEGAEFEIIRSLDKHHFDKIDSFLIEYHEWNGGTKQELVDKLTENGYKVFQSKDSMFIFAKKIYNELNKNPKIQAIHLLTNTTADREKRSIASISKLSEYGVDYKQQINKIYDELPPYRFCNRPEHISEKNESLGNGYGTLTGRHYGCYLAHTNAILNIDDKYDYTLIFEADANIETSYEEFLDMVYKCCEQSLTDDVYFFGLANNFCPNPIPVNSMFNQSVTQNLAHAYLIPNRYKNWYVDRVSDVQWDVSDIWLNEVFLRYNKKRYATTKCYSNQISGPSLIDNVVKWDEQPNKNHFDYVEIGTSDFETLVEIMPESYKGLSVEPIIEYLEKLPNVSGNTKVNKAISNRNGEATVYYVDEKTIQEHDLPSWVKGCNSINKPHPSITDSNLISTRKIEMISFSSFVEQFGIESIDFLKIDTEGHDFIILENMLETNIRPKKLHFEANTLYSEQEIQDIIRKLQNAGYHLTQRTTIDITMSLVDETYIHTKKPVMIISTGRRLSYFKRTMENLLNKNPDLSSKLEKIWILDDRSSSEDRLEMDKLMSTHFGDKYNSIHFNSNSKFDFIEKFKMIRNLITKDDVVFLLEDDWECHDNLRIDYHVNRLLQSDWTQIAFADPLYIQDSEIIKNYMIDFDYWKNPYPDVFKHPHEWDSDVCFWNKCYINNWTNNPSLIKGEAFFKAQFKVGPGFEQNFANELNGNQVFSNECIFRHFGKDSLINKL